MSVFHLKLLAIIFMTIDHIGLFFFPDVLLFRIIGRLAFPLFAWLIANGVRYTKSKKQYALRLFLFALISQIPFQLSHLQIIPDFFKLNIFFTLFLGLLAILAVTSLKQKFLSFGIILLAAWLAEFLQTDYGAAGVLSIVAFYFLYERIQLAFLTQLLIFFLFYTLPALTLYGTLSETLRISPVALFQPVAAFSLLFIAQYNRQLGPKMQYVFYVFYPLHLLLIYLYNFYLS